VIDGGSTDGTQELVAKYDKWLSYWVSEPDRGQAQAINKGLSKITGDIWNFLNSDDYLMPGAFYAIGVAHAKYPQSLLVGDVEEFWDNSEQHILFKQRGINFKNMVEFWYGKARWYQPGIFSPLSLLGRINTLDESLHYSLDYDLLCRLTSITQSLYLNRVLARARSHKASKTVQSGYLFAIQNREVSSRFWNCSATIDVPAYVRSEQAFLFRQGLRWLFLGKRREGMQLAREAMGGDWLGVLALNILSLPKWFARFLASRFDSWVQRHGRTPSGVET
jgi:glycosyltransferase involved in cell wall biosynthesis